MSQLSTLNAKRVGLDTPLPRGRQRGERRTQLRLPPHGDYAVSFAVDNRPYTAVLKDVSPCGAGLLVSTPANDLHLEAGLLLELSIRTPWETVCRKGRVVHSRAEPGSVHAGIQYVELPHDADCLGLLNMDKVKIDPALALRVPANLALRRQVLPFALADGKVHVACLNVTDQASLQALEKLLSASVCAEPAEPESLRRALDRVFGDSAAANGAPARPRSVDVRAPGELQPNDIISLCDDILHAAILRQASDIHVDPEPDGVQIRFRVDGVLERYGKLPVNVTNGLLSRLKVLCGMDIAEKRAPQDGAFKHRFGRTGQMVDIRVATLPTKYGERMTLRLLALQTEALTLERLGMCARDLQTFQQAIDKPHGMILLTGPTGSGKTTTLYAAIRRLMAKEDLNILTVEDPIEYEIRGVAQAEVDAADKVTFVKALRSVLRHDPDVVMIGEIRDAETAGVAIKASLTGHLVFSTLHTNSAVGVITRLADMGIERFLIAATLRLAVAQRLVRALCPRCRQPRQLTPAQAGVLDRPTLVGQSVYEAKGCVYCGGRGYVGRVGLFEMLPLDATWSEIIAHGTDEAALIARMRDLKIGTLLDDGVEKLLAGTTSLQEVLTAVSVW
jgi:type II secretory ATPase GspE/PulE/Tfp pilus assembly ATPase PilB-like protein